ncbi:TerB family tellurite resistance protein [Prevotella sp. A2931]|uniref:TerB family tellurite resistance protein n=1 Tax=Prevotella illustrans TaxID=2800387 RepID=A0ABS3M6U1_9BACT|nr:MULTISPECIES: TerB family tellurite resistance protein [Prevotella]MBO1363854.1 TerB family tellurite resistance protein [Prevotella illustrans]PTL26271.1 molecular chaperone DjlA [Prevotella sp. oral taxon 820]
MALGKWIGGFLGFISGGGILGMLAGFALGSLFDKGLDAVNTPDNLSSADNEAARQRYRQQSYEGQRNSFMFCLLVLSSYIIKADGRVMHSEMEFVRSFLRNNFGEAAAVQGDDILRKLFEKQKQMGNVAYRDAMRDACVQIARNMDVAQRLQLLNYLVLIAKADGQVTPDETLALKEMARYMGLSEQEVDSMLNLSKGAGDLNAAYRVLEISPQATDIEVKAAYRRMALKHHPDRVATLGDDVKHAAERKFQEINEAKERIFKARGMT